MTNLENKRTQLSENAKIKEYIMLQNINFTRLPVGDLIIDQDNQRLKYSPQKDITPLEVSMLLRLFLCNMGYFDYLSFIKENKLERHFCSESDNCGYDEFGK